jgi:hypothetical protein
MYKAIKLLAPVILFLASGCASVRTASDEADRAAKKFEPQAQESSIYINQDGEVPTSAPFLFCTALDGKGIARISCNRYQLINASPGIHTLSVIGNDHVEEETFLAEAGKLYFFNITAQRGWMSITPKVKQVDDSTGRALVNKSKRADTTFSSAQ